MEEGGEGENGWIGVLINAKSSLGKSDCKCSALVSIVKNSSKNEKKPTNKLLFYLQWTIIGPVEGRASSRALSTSCTSSRRGGALSGVF